MAVDVDLPYLTMRRRQAMLAFEDGKLPVADAELSELVTILGDPAGRPARSELASCLNDRATVRRYANRYADALADLNLAVTAADGLAPLPRRAILTSVLCSRAGLLARPDSGIQDLDQAAADLAGLKELGLAGWLAGEIECQIAFQVEDWQAVVDASATTIDRFDREGFPVAVAFSRLRLGEALTRLGDDATAAVEVAAARGFLERHGPPDRLASALLLDARLSARRGEHERAWELVERALSELENLIRHFRSLEDQQRFVRDKLTSYGHAFDIALAAGGPAAVWRAWSVAERAKSFYLSQLMANADVGLFDGLDAGPAQRLPALDDEMDAVEIALANCGPERREQLAEVQAGLRAEHRQLIGDAMRANPRWASLRTPAPIDVEAAVSALPAGWNVLAHFWRDTPDGHLLHVFLAGGDGTCAHEVVAWTHEQLEQLEAHVSRLALEADTNIFLKAFPAGVADMVVPPAVAAALPHGEPLLVSSHGVLAATALQALPVGPGGERLIERCPVVLIPSLALLNRPPRPPAPDAVLLLGCGQDGFGHPPLPDAPVEVRSLEELWAAGGRPVRARFMGPGDTLTAVGEPPEVWAGYGLVHVACHGEFDVADPLNAALLLGADRLRADTFFTVKVGADLVVLSACDLGRRHRERAGADRGFDEWVGFYIPLLYAGARMLLASRWKANSQQAARFMTALHQAMASGQPPVQAVQTASLALAGAPEPFWANWALVGVPPGTT